jgi:hypothetical protein
MAPQVYQIAALLDALVDAVETARAPLGDGSRWLTAVNVAADWLLQQDAVTFDAETHELTVNSPSGKTYRANGICQCGAFTHSNACWHRAAARLVRRALETRLHEVEALADELYAVATSGTWYDARQLAAAQLDDLLALAAEWDTNAAALASVETKRTSTTARIARAQAVAMELFS